MVSVGKGHKSEAKCGRGIINYRYADWIRRKQVAFAVVHMVGFHEKSFLW